MKNILIQFKQVFSFSCILILLSCHTQDRSIIINPNVSLCIGQTSYLVISKLEEKILTVSTDCGKNRDLGDINDQSLQKNQDLQIAASVQTPPRWNSSNLPCAIVNPLDGVSTILKGIAASNTVCQTTITVTYKEQTGTLKVIVLPNRSPQIGLEVTSSDNALLVNNSISGCGGNQNITVKNIGNVPILNMSATLPQTLVDAGVTSTNNCGLLLRPDESCDFAFIPGNINASTTQVTISGTSLKGAALNPVFANITVLGYGSLYEEGYVFALTCANGLFASGKIIALEDQATFVKWNSSAAVQTSAIDKYNGAINTAILTAPQFEAANTCRNYNSGSYTDWYLPAICEMGSYIGTGCVPGTPNIAENLPDLRNDIPPNLQGGYWSSTEVDPYQIPNSILGQNYFSGTLPSCCTQGYANPSNGSKVRCARAIVQ